MAKFWERVGADAVYSPGGRRASRAVRVFLISSPSSTPGCACADIRRGPASVARSPNPAEISWSERRFQWAAILLKVLAPSESKLALKRLERLG